MRTKSMDQSHNVDRLSNYIANHHNSITRQARQAERTEKKYEVTKTLLFQLATPVMFFFSSSSLVFSS